MRVFSLSRIRASAVAALTAGAALVAVLGPAGPAQAALSGHNWIKKTLPANYFIGGGGAPLSPVSCVQATKFCVVIANDSANLVNGSHIGQAALVTTDAGKTWTGYATLPSTFQVTALSCPSTSVCWVSGLDWKAGEPAVAETTDGGQQWTDKTPASWSTASWWATGIDCVSAANCWLVGPDEPAGLVNPAVVETADGGTSWTAFTNLPAITSADPNGTYQLNGISCQSTQSCVAVGGLGYQDGKAVAISTTDGGSSWNLWTAPAASNLPGLNSVSCVPVTGKPLTCAAAGYSITGPIAQFSHDGGLTWGKPHAFGKSAALNSISCASTTDCWAAGAGTNIALVGTKTGGKKWSAVKSETSNQDGSVSCLSTRVCVATTDNGLWVTFSNGGL